MTGLTTMLSPSADPLITHYDVGTGERTELSRVTTLNWIHKTAGFLTLDLDAQIGTRVRLGLPTHWLRFVWIAACWRVGAEVTDITDGRSDIGVSGPELTADEPVKVASALLPFGARFPAAPTGFLDIAVEVPGQDDAFAPWDEPDDTALAIDSDGWTADQGTVWNECPPSHARLLLTPSTLRRDAAALVAACRGAGSLVTVTGGSAADLRRIAEQEHVTADDEPLTTP